MTLLRGDWLERRVATSCPGRPGKESREVSEQTRSARRFQALNPIGPQASIGDTVEQRSIDWSKHDMRLPSDSDPNIQTLE